WKACGRRLSDDVDDLLHHTDRNFATGREEHAAAVDVDIHADLWGVVTVARGQRVVGVEPDIRREGESRGVREARARGRGELDRVLDVEPLAKLQVARPGQSEERHRSNRASQAAGVQFAAEQLAAGVANEGG